MKVLFINCSDGGSTGKIARDTSQYLRRNGYETVLCVPKIHRANNEYDRCYAVSRWVEQGIYRRIGHFLSRQYNFAPLSDRRIRQILKKEQPDLVHLHCLNGYFVHFFKLMQYLKRHHIPTVVTNHAEFYYTGNCAHAFDCDRWLQGCGNCPHIGSYTDPMRKDTTAASWQKMKRAFADFPELAVTSVSPWVHSRCIRSPIMEGVACRVVENGIDTTLFHPVDPDGLREKLEIPVGQKVVFHATAYFDTVSDKKGGKYIMELARQPENRDTLFIVAGPYPSDLEIPKNMRFLGRVNPEELPAYYSAADVSIIASRGETFGMTVAESLCCGTPVVGFCAGGPESIAPREYAEFCPFGEIDELNVLLQKQLGKKTPALSAEISRYCAKRFSIDEMTRHYAEIYRKVLRK